MGTPTCRTSRRGWSPLPLVLLAIPSVVIGYITINPMLYGDFLKGAITVNAAAHPAMEPRWRNTSTALRRWPCTACQTVPFWLALAGVVTAYVFYMVAPSIPATGDQGCCGADLIIVLENKYYMDWFNENVLARLARAASAPACGRAAMPGLIDGVIIDGSAKAGWRHRRPGAPSAERSSLLVRPRR